jgi:hypothetical protein
MLSLSADGDKNGILWAAIHATGDSWAESQPGVLHAYDADDINHELWNSLSNAPRDNCDNYSKMAPPTVANGMVYLASFGTHNIGTGQFCVYGLLPGGPPSDAPMHLQAAMHDQSVSLNWTPVAGARSYIVESTQGGTWHRVASGLTRPSYSDPAEATGKVEYTVRAVNANGPSARSTAAEITIIQVPVARMPMPH